MISHFNIGVNDLDGAEAFYNGVLGLFDGKPVFRTERAIFYAFAGNGAKLAINKPFDGQLASHGNGAMVALSAASKEQVNAVYEKALALGGSSEGEPGDRMEGIVYAAYFRDPEGNKCGVFYAPNTLIG